MKKENRFLSHVDAAGRPRMVDITAKVPAVRVAVAETRVAFPAAVAAELRRNGLRAAKGPIVDTAIIAGVMAAKRTHELIPFCHPLPLERCEIRIDFVTDNALGIECEVATTHKTGVEMEALTGASVAALTVYDMCKALTHAMRVGPLRLREKSGGRRVVKNGREHT